MLKMKRQAVASTGCPLGALETNGHPINQEDLAATLASFSVVPLWCLGRFGFSTTHQQRADWMALWRTFLLLPLTYSLLTVLGTIGFYMGIKESILTKHFASYNIGQYFLASVAVDMIPNDLTNAPTPPTLPMLEAIASRGPYGGTFGHQCAWSRWLLGDSLSDAIGLPRTHLFTWITIQLSIFTQNSIMWFGLYYARLGRPGWNEERIDLTRISLPVMVRLMTGMRKVKFRPRAEQPRVKGFHPEFDELDPIDLDAKCAIQMRWMFLLAEMVLIILVSMNVTILAFSFSTKYAWRTAYARPLTSVPTCGNA
jgi:hypothetical protein